MTKSNIWKGHRFNLINMIIMVEFVLIKLKDYEEIYPGVIVEGLLSRVILFVGLPFQI